MRSLRAWPVAVVAALAMLVGGTAVAATDDGIDSRDEALQSITDGLALIDDGQAKVQAGRDWLAANPPPADEEPPPSSEPPPTTEPPAGEITATAAVVAGEDEARVDWQTTRTDITGWHIERDGTDTTGYGAWSTDLPADARTWTFDLLRSGTTYRFTLTPRTATGDLEPVVTEVTMPGATGPTSEPTPTGEPEPTEPPATGEPPAAGQDTAAARYGWGTPLAAGSDEFNGTAVDTSKWVLPNGCFAGHAGNGRRCADNSTVGDGVLTQTLEPNGDTGWMQSKHNSYRGRWETRMRVVDTPGRDNEAHPVILLWPVAEDFPVGGEVDYAEATATSDKVSFFLHFGASNSQTQASRPVDLTDWHTYGVEWTADCIVGYLDAQEWFRDCNRNHLPPRAMKTAIQLDYFPDGSPGPGETRMQVDWHRFYAAP